MRLRPWIDLKKDIDLLPRRIFLLLFIDRGAIVAILLHELLDIRQSAINLVGAEQLSQLEFRGIDDLPGSGPVGNTLNVNPPNEVIRGRKKREVNFAIVGSLSFDSDVRKAPSDDEAA